MTENKRTLTARMLLRVSSRQQTNAEGDLPTQRRLVKDYIDNNQQWRLDQVKPEYFEGGVSGFKNSVSQRKALQEILEDAKNKEFDILVCYKDDRLGRREDEIPQYIKKLARFGVTVYTVKDGCITPENHTDDLLTYIRYWHAEGASRDTGLRVKDAAIELVKQGRNQGGRAPFGYRLMYSGQLNKRQRALKKKVIVPEEAEVVRYIYELAVTYEYGAQKIAKTLNASQDLRALSPNGREWKTTTVSDLLKNPIYTGYEAYNRRTHTAGQYQKLDQKYWILSEQCQEELKIIDLDIWEKAQQKREKRKEKYGAKEKKKETNRYSMTGRLALIDVAYCGDCGRKLTNGSKYNYWTTRRGEKKSSVVCYYRCQTKHQGGMCQGRTLYRADQVEPQIMAFVKAYLDYLEDNAAVVKQLEETAKKTQREKKERKRKLRARAMEIEKDIAALKAHLPKALRGELNIPPELFYEQIKEKTQMKQTISEQLALLPDKVEQKERDANVKQCLSRMPKWSVAFENADLCVKRMIIDKLIARVDIKQRQSAVRVNVNLDSFFA